jgi:hypothetical protein
MISTDYHTKSRRANKSANQYTKEEDMAEIVVTPSSPLNLTQPQQTFTDTVVIEGGQIIAQGIQVAVTFTELRKLANLT